MILTGQFKFLGMEQKTNSNDASKVYFNATLLQGIDPVKVGVQAESIPAFKDIKQMDEIIATLNVSIGKEYSFAKITDIKPIK